MNRLLLVGWDAADWKIIRPLLAAGDMPHLARLIEHGAHGNLATIYPPLSPMLWTSIATGKRPYKHGIHGFAEPAEDGLSIRPISNLGRKTKAFWNILNQNGKRSIVVGWWPSHPAEPIRGAMVSDHFAPPTSRDPSAPLPPGTVWPKELARDLSELRVHGAEITGEILSMFAPDFAKVDQSKDKSVHDLAGLIAETMSIHAAATELIEHQEWDVAAIYYVGIDHFSHRFMRYHAGKVSNPQTADPAIFAGVVANAYRYHDVMLGRLLALAGEDCAVMLLSDHGFHSDRLLPDYIPAEAAGPAAEHRHFGIFCLKAPGVPPGREIYGASVLDIAPTVLHLCGLPAGSDMDGKVLLNAFDKPEPIPAITSWDEVPGEDGCHPAWRQYDGGAAAEALQQLVDLGYIAAPGEDARETVAQTVAESRYNLARSYMDASMPYPAEEILEDLLAKDREQGRYYLHLFECKFMANHYAGCAEILDRFDAACAEFSPKAAAELARRLAERPDSELELDAQGRPDPKEYALRRKLAEKAAGFDLQRVIARTRLLLAEANLPGKEEAKQAAREWLTRLEAFAEERVDLAMFLGTGFATLRDFPRALTYARRAQQLDRDHWQAMALEARIHQAAGRHRQSVECALDSLALVYVQPTLHYHLGISLRHLGDEEHAEQAFRTAVSQMPGLIGAYEELTKILRKDDKRAGEAGIHQAQAEMLRKEAERRGAGLAKPAAHAYSASTEPSGSGLPGLDLWQGEPPANRSTMVTIVSGLPRSGTSMMMQLLAAAGIPAYTDGRRIPDEDNPRGYFEHEQAIRLHESSDWLPEARGKAVKIVAQLLPRLPATEDYRIVFMHRNLEEVVASQRAMLDRLGRAQDSLQDENLKQIYAGQLVRVQEWLRRAPGVQVLAVNYTQALADPATTAARLAAFLGEPFDALTAARAIEPALRRQVAEASAKAPA